MSCADRMAPLKIHQKSSENTLNFPLALINRGCYSRPYQLDSCPRALSSCRVFR
jgi:hypothetical protein